jgi:hypothetical protein
MYLCCNLKSVEKNKKTKREQLMEDKKEIPKKFATPISTIKGGIGIKEEFRSSWY